ncbi:hypothetical protein [Mycoplasma hafezii]|uniref:hypothetical protein n=1 Tax=Mycoplasma hafezii TaxID=525886 RepID=UPI003CED9605
MKVKKPLLILGSTTTILFSATAVVSVETGGDSNSTNNTNDPFRKENGFYVEPQEIHTSMVKEDQYTFSNPKFWDTRRKTTGSPVQLRMVDEGQWQQAEQEWEITFNNDYVFSDGELSEDQIKKNKEEGFDYWKTTTDNQLGKWTRNPRFSIALSKSLEIVPDSFSLEVYDRRLQAQKTHNNKPIAVYKDLFTSADYNQKLMSIYWETIFNPDNTKSQRPMWSGGYDLDAKWIENHWKNLPESNDEFGYNYPDYNLGVSYSSSYGLSATRVQEAYDKAYTQWYKKYTDWREKGDFSKPMPQWLYVPADGYKTGPVFNPKLKDMWKVYDWDWSNISGRNNSFDNPIRLKQLEENPEIYKNVGNFISFQYFTSERTKQLGSSANDDLINNQHHFKVKFKTRRNNTLIFGSQYNRRNPDQYEVDKYVTDTLVNYGDTAFVLASYSSYDFSTLYNYGQIMQADVSHILNYEIDLKGKRSDDTDELLPTIHYDILDENNQPINDYNIQVNNLDQKDAFYSRNVMYAKPGTWDIDLTNKLQNAKLKITRSGVHDYLWDIQIVNQKYDQAAQKLTFEVEYKYDEKRLLPKAALEFIYNAKYLTLAQKQHFADIVTAEGFNVSQWENIVRDDITKLDKAQEVLYNKHEELKKDPDYSRETNNFVFASEEPKNEFNDRIDTTQLYLDQFPNRRSPYNDLETVNNFIKSLDKEIKLDGDKWIAEKKAEIDTVIMPLNKGNSKSENETAFEKWLEKSRGGKVWNGDYNIEDMTFYEPDPEDPEHKVIEVTKPVKIRIFENMTPREHVEFKIKKIQLDVDAISKMKYALDTSEKLTNKNSSTYNYESLDDNYSDEAIKTYSEQYNRGGKSDRKDFVEALKNGLRDYQIWHSKDSQDVKALMSFETNSVEQTKVTNTDADELLKKMQPFTLENLKKNELRENVIPAWIYLKENQKNALSDKIDAAVTVEELNDLEIKGNETNDLMHLLRDLNAEAKKDDFYNKSITVLYSTDAQQKDYVEAYKNSEKFLANTTEEITDVNAEKTLVKQTTDKFKQTRNSLTGSYLDSREVISNFYWHNDLTEKFKEISNYGMEDGQEPYFKDDVPTLADIVLDVF